MFKITREPPEGELKPIPHPTAFCEHVWHWPEFQAFANRLGIPLELYHTQVIIEFDPGKPVMVYQVIQGVDGAKDA